MQHANNGHGMRRESAADQRNNTHGQATRTTREDDRSGHPRYGSRAAQTSFYGAGGRPRQQPQYSQFDDDYHSSAWSADTQYDDRWDPPTDRYQYPDDHADQDRFRRLSQDRDPESFYHEHPNHDDYHTPRHRRHQRRHQSRSRSRSRSRGRNRSRSRSRRRRSHSRSRHRRRRRRHRSRSPDTKMEKAAKTSINPPDAKIQRAIWTAHDAEIKAAGAFVSEEEKELLLTRPPPLKVGQDMPDEHMQFQLKLMAIRAKDLKRARPKPPFYGTIIKKLHHLCSSVIYGPQLQGQPYS